MADLIERYIHEVGRYVPQKERAEIEAELRSQIQDQLEDRFGGEPTADDVATVLRELGDPRRMATSYGSEQYLIGPALYPFMMNVLRKGWVIVPTIVVIVNVVVALFGQEPVTLGGLLVRLILNVLQALWIFSAIVVTIFAILQHSGEDLDEITGRAREFDPADLPEVDEPGRIDRYEEAFGVAFGSFGVLLLLYFLRVGGLTLRFNLTDPGEVLPVPMAWLALLTLNTAALVVLSLLALRRNRWTVGTLLADTALELFGAVCFYYAIVTPVFAWMVEAWPGLANLPFLGRAPEIFLAASLVIAFVSGISKIVKLVSYRPGGEAQYKVKGA